MPSQSDVNDDVATVQRRVHAARIKEASFLFGQKQTRTTFSLPPHDHLTKNRTLILCLKPPQFLIPVLYLPNLFMTTGSGLMTILSSELDLTLRLSFSSRWTITVCER